MTKPRCVALVARTLTEFEVVHAADGLEAVAALEHGAFDVIVTDLEMPHMCGDELVAWVAANRPELVSRIVVVTGRARAFQSDRKWLESFDAARIVRKPASADVLISTIERAAKRSS